MNIATIALLAALCSCAALTPATKGQIATDTTDVIDLTNAACGIVGVVDPALLLPATITCDIIDATGAVVEHLVHTTTPTKALAIVKKHPKAVVVLAK